MADYNIYEDDLETTEKNTGSYSTEQKPVQACDQWLEPIPLMNTSCIEVYPIGVFPDLIKNAIKEVQEYVQAPMALVASSALSAVSLALQGHVDAERDKNLKSPVSLYILVVADSGERKSTCDKYFTQSIKEYEKTASVEQKPLIHKYNSLIEVWETQKTALKNQFKAKHGKGITKEDFEYRLFELEQNKPIRPKEPRILLADETPENLAWSLNFQWCSSGLFSSEAGTVLGARGMNSESLMQNLSMLNVLWDGGSLSIGRKTSESFLVSDVRLSICLQIQPTTLEIFMKKTLGLARGSGFLARFLIAFPESTQGTRFYREPPEKMECLDAFNDRILSFMKKPLPMDNDRLKQDVLVLSKEAKAYWEIFYNSTERELKVGGEYTDIGDVVSKIADNAVRIAGLFHVFENRYGNEITEQDMQSGCIIARWYLHQAKRYVSTISLPDSIKDAVEMENWLKKECKNKKTDTIQKRFIQQHGVSRLRRDDTLTPVLRLLASHNRLKILNESGRTVIKLNPAIFD